MIDRELLEKTAIEIVCACRYFDLADTIDEASDEDLQKIIDHTIPCEICGN